MPGCSPNDTEGTKAVKTNADEACVILRQFVSTVCFGGKTDKGHRDELKKAKEKLQKCKNC